jgi:hypothetical protein
VEHSVQLIVRPHRSSIHKYIQRMNYYVSLAFNLFIIIVALLGWMRFTKISPVFLPFLIFVWVGTINEIYSAIIVTLYRQNNIANYNIYILFEPLLILWQFQRWNLFGTKYKIYWFLFFAFIGFWLLETIFHSKLYLDFNSYYQVFYSAVIVLMSISMLNQILMKERKSVLKSSIFIICCGFIISFTYTLSTQSFTVYRLQMSESFIRNLFFIFTFINLFCNILYAIAILWMPRKQAFTLQY